MRSETSEYLIMMITNKLTISKFHPPRIKNYMEYAQEHITGNPTKTIKMSYHVTHAYNSRIKKS